MVEFGPAPIFKEATPYLYILMRTDMDSMNPGKAVAQGSHATAQFINEMDMLTPDDHPLLNLFAIWQEEGDGFGTTICLGMTGWQLEKLVEFAKEAGIIAGLTHDPEYPLKDGNTLHLIPMDTCGYMFGDKDILKILLGQFGLHP